MMRRAQPQKVEIESGTTPRMSSNNPSRVATRTQLSDKASYFLVLVVWSLLLLSVQPWSRADSLGGGDSSSAFKGVVLAACVVMLMIAIPSRSVFTISPPLAIYLAYGAYLILTAGLLPDSLNVVIRSGRVLAGLLLPVLLWPLVAKKPERLIYTNLLAYLILAVSVVAGLLSGSRQSWLDGVAFSSGGRLMGAYLPMMPPRVGEIGAICIGLAVILWAARKFPLWFMLLVVPLGASLIVLSRTRTAPLALLLGLVVAVTFTIGSPQGRRMLLFIMALVAMAMPFTSGILAWVLRNQDAEMIGKLSGRTLVWEHILSLQVSPVTMWFGHGLGDKKVLLRRGEGDINVMAIDNSWLDAYWETGIVGVGFIALVMIVALIYVLRTPGSLSRATALFLMTYVFVASINESGLCDLSSLTLLVLVAVTVSAADRASAAVGGVSDRMNSVTGTSAKHGPTVKSPTEIEPAYSQLNQLK